MCGIIGFLGENKALIKKMTAMLSHRGPDDAGMYTDRFISLGHRRLSILDLSKKGKQPMLNETKNVIVIFNGEIYNYPSLRDELKKKGHKFESTSDTEVIVHGYEEYGDAICEKLEGMFAFAIWDLRKRKLLIARDHVGEKPLYYYRKDDKFVFSSEIKSILVDESIPRTVDLQNLADYLELRYSSGNRTMFAEIKKVLPGTCITHEKGEFKERKFYKLPTPNEDIKPDKKVVEKLIENAVGKRLASDVPLGVFLSGGLDSSAIVAHMSKFREGIKTFSVGFGEVNDELKYARIIAEKYHTNHKEIILNKDVLANLTKVIWHFDEPIADPAAIPTYLLAKEVSKHVKVVLSGEGGDEVFGGYQTLNLLPKLKKIGSMPGFLRKRVLSSIAISFASLFAYPKKQILQLGAEILASSDNLNEMYKKLFYLPFNPDDKKALLNENFKNLKFTTVFDSLLSEEDLFENTEKYYFEEWLPNDLLMKADKMSMAHGLEVRVPFLDLQLIKYFRSIPFSEKHERKLFRESVSDLLPESILKRPKQGFTLPMSEWFTDDNFFKRVKPHLKDLEKRKLFNLIEYKQIIDFPEDFRNDHRIWVLLNLELWYKLYIDKTPIERIRL